MITRKIISRLEEIELPLWIFGIWFYFPFGNKIELGWKLIRFMPPFVGPEMPRWGRDQISAMYKYDLGFVSVHSFMKLVCTLGNGWNSCLPSLLWAIDGLFQMQQPANADDPKLLLRPLMRVGAWHEASVFCFRPSDCSAISGDQK